MNRAEGGGLDGGREGGGRGLEGWRTGQDITPPRRRNAGDGLPKRGGKLFTVLRSSERVEGHGWGGKGSRMRRGDGGGEVDRKGQGVRWTRLRDEFRLNARVSATAF